MIGEPLGHGRDRELLGSAVAHLVPDSGVDTRASGVARTEYADATVRSLAFWLKSTKTPSRSSFHQRAVARSGARRSTSRAIVSCGQPNLLERPLSLDAGIDVEAARSGRLGPGRQAVILEHLPGDERDLDDLAPIHAGHRVQVDAQFVGVVEVVGAHRVGVEVDTTQVDRPDQPGGVSDDGFFGRRARRVLELGDVDVVGSLLRRPLLEDGLLADALDEPLEDHRPAATPRSAPSATRQVVVDEVAFRDPGLRENDLVRVGDLHLLSVHVQRQGSGHIVMVITPSRWDARR